LLGSGKKDVVEKCADVLRKRYDGIKIVGTHLGLPISILDNSEQETDITYEAEVNNEILADIITAAPAILIVAFGHIKQEEWIQQNLKDLPGVQVAIGVGGAFDMLSGYLRRAPRLFRFFGSYLKFHPKTFHVY
jgi:N-acetylglucosaminyldiphosphoundecaprenol N-acetyl-beta-D-mannosaminyltransferase